MGRGTITDNHFFFHRTSFLLISVLPILDWCLFIFFSFPQYINKTGFRVCFKELFESKYDPLFITYTVLSGKSFIMLGLEINWFRNSIQLIFYFVNYSLITQLKQIRQNYLVITRFSCIFFPYISNNAISRIKLSPFCTNQKKLNVKKQLIYSYYCTKISIAGL